jgi:16S rRNA (cytidine1402-2'-O)-methyltransferase
VGRGRKDVLAGSPKWDHLPVGGRLFLVGTPIGNLGDLSPRARATLSDVDVIAAEDTRRSGKLLASIGVKARLVSFFEGNERQRTEELLHLLRADQDVAVVTDGGMPGISDPGFRLVREAASEGFEVHVVPGPSAVIAALVASGLPTDRWTFEGFLPRKRGDRHRRLEQLVRDPRTLVVFEAPTRVRTLLRDVLVMLGDREVAVARELTKLHEEVLRGRASEVLEKIAGSELKGEVAVVIAGSQSSEPEPEDLEDLLVDVRELVAEGMRKREAAHQIARLHGVSVNALYRELLKG